MRRSTKSSRKASSRKPSILGLPIEGADHRAPRKTILDAVVETRRLELPRNDSYQGKLPATKVYKRVMTEFENCRATAWMLVDETQDTVTYCNTYNGRLPASYNPTHYRHPINPKTLAKKVEIYEEVEDREEWPSFVEIAATKRSRKHK